MDLGTIVGSLVGSAIGAPAAVALLNLLGNWAIERRKSVFSIGISSHMADVFFDKHIEFCEAYLKAASAALYALTEEGEDDPLLDTRVFSGIRREWALWLTPEIEIKLDRYERDLPRLGGEAQVYEAQGPPSTSNENSINRLIADLRELLGTKELTDLRSEWVTRSSKKRYT